MVNEILPLCSKYEPRLLAQSYFHICKGEDGINAVHFAPRTPRDTRHRVQESPQVRGGYGEDRPVCTSVASFCRCISRPSLAGYWMVAENYVRVRYRSEEIEFQRKISTD